MINANNEIEILETFDISWDIIDQEALSDPFFYVEMFFTIGNITINNAIKIIQTKGCFYD